MQQEFRQETEIIEQVNQEYPMIALRGLVVFPNMSLNFDISRKFSALAVEEGMARGEMVFLVKQKYVSTEEPGFEDLETVGCFFVFQETRQEPKYMQYPDSDFLE